MHIKPSMILLVERCMLNRDSRRRESHRLFNDCVIHFTLNDSDQSSDIRPSYCAPYRTYTRHGFSQP